VRRCAVGERRWAPVPPGPSAGASFARSPCASLNGHTLAVSASRPSTCTPALPALNLISYVYIAFVYVPPSLMSLPASQQGGRVASVSSAVNATISAGLLYNKGVNFTQLYARKLLPASSWFSAPSRRKSPIPIVRPRVSLGVPPLSNAMPRS
jgi:hypothetical protein